MCDHRTSPTHVCILSLVADFYRFAFLFSLEGSHRVIGESFLVPYHLLRGASCPDSEDRCHVLHFVTERDLIIELLPMVIGRRSEYTDKFIEFLKTTKKPEEKITADQVRRRSAVSGRVR